MTGGGGERAGTAADNAGKGDGHVCEKGPRHC